MTKSERFMAALRGETPDRIPWAIFPGLIVGGECELRLRQGEMAYYLITVCHRMSTPHCEIVDVWTRDYAKSTRTAQRTYRTPDGELRGSLGSKLETAFHGMFPDSIVSRNVPGENDWPLECFIKGVHDYPAMKALIRDTQYRPEFSVYQKVKEWQGGQGVPIAVTWKTPFQALLYDWMGLEVCYAELLERPDQFRDLYRVMVEKELEIYRILADSPVEVIWIAENLDANMTSPDAFEEFCMPFYEDVCAMLQPSGKLVGIHADGRLRGLEKLIANTPLDYIDGYTPPPMNNLPLEEARALWPDKTILCNFPGSEFFRSEDEIEAYARDLLRKVAPGDRFMLVSTENFPMEHWEKTFGVLEKVLREHGAYPLRS